MGGRFTDNGGILTGNRGSFTDSGGRHPSRHHRLLVVANRLHPVSGLSQAALGRCAHRPSMVHVLVARRRHPVLVPDPLVGSVAAEPDRPTIRVDDAEYGLAETRLASFLREFSGTAPWVTGEVATTNPLRATRRLALWDTFDEIVVLTRRRPGSRIRRDLVQRLRRRCEVPVTPVELPLRTA